MKYIFPTKSESTSEETTVGITPTNPSNATNKGIFVLFLFPDIMRFFRDRLLH